MKYKFVKYYLFIVLTLFVITLPAQNQSVDNMYRLAQSFEQAGELERAKQIYEQIYNLQPNNYGFLEALNNIYISLKEYDKSINLLQERITANPGNINDIALLGTTYYTKGDTSKAFEVWEEGLEKSKNSMAGYRTIVTTVIQNRIFEKAIEYLKQADNYGFDNPVFNLDLAYIYSITMKYDKAAKEYISIIEKDPNQTRNVINRMNQYLNRPEAVDETIETVKNYSPQNSASSYYEILVNLYKLDENYQKALEFTIKLDEIEQGTGRNIYQFANNTFNEDKPEISAAAYEFIIENYPSSPLIPTSKIGYAKSQEMLINQKIDSVRTDWKPYSKNEVVFERELKKIIKSFRSLLDNYNDIRIADEVSFRIAEIYKNKLNKPDSAEIVLSEMINSSQNSAYVTPAKLSLAEIKINNNRLDEAKKLLVDVNSTSKISLAEKDHARLLLGKIYFWESEFKKALDLLGEITEHLVNDDANDALQLMTLISTTKNDSVNLAKYAEGDKLAHQREFEQAAVIFKSLSENENLLLLGNISKLKYAQMQIAVDKYSAALTILEELVSAEGVNLYAADAEFLRGQIYFNAINDYDKALASFENILENYSNSLYFDKSRKIINYIKSIKEETI